MAPERSVDEFSFHLDADVRLRRPVGILPAGTIIPAGIWVYFERIRGTEPEMLFVNYGRETAEAEKLTDLLNEASDIRFMGHGDARDWLALNFGIGHPFGAPVVLWKADDPSIQSRTGYSMDPVRGRFARFSIQPVRGCWVAFDHEMGCSFKSDGVKAAKAWCAERAAELVGEVA